jgi:hypothetical protein
MNAGVTGIFLCAPVLPLLVKYTVGRSAVRTRSSPAAILSIHGACAEKSCTGTALRKSSIDRIRPNP